jgi:predicted RNase H-like HicB family nuclease
MKMYSVVITEENGWLVALEPDSGVASQGKTLDEAVRNIREALELYVEELAA